MAFQSTRNQSNAGNFNRSNNAAARKDSGESKSIQITGMYDGKQGSKLIAKGMKLKEPVTIPAGYTVKLFVKGGKSKTGKDLPTYELVAQPPRSDV